MQNPLYAILVPPDQSVRDSILEGGKAITIRLGHRDYRPGPAMLCCHIDPWAVMANITSVRHCILSEVTAEEMADDGFPDEDRMLAKLMSYYPDIAMDSEVTVIRWNWDGVPSPGSY